MCTTGPTNRRLITNLCTFSKVLEKLALAPLWPRILRQFQSLSVGLLPNSTTWTPATDMLYTTPNRHHQRTSSQQVVDAVKHVRSRLNLLYNILPAADILYNTTNGRAHNNSTTCCTTNSPPTDKNLPHPNIWTC